MKDKIRICFFVGSFQAGGAEKHVLDILNGIDYEKYTPFLCVFSNSGNYKERYDKLSVPIYEFKHHRLNYPAKWINMLRFISFLKRSKIELIHIHLVGCFRFALTGAILAGIKHRFITWHNVYTPQTKPLEQLKKIKWGNKRATGILAVSEKVKKEGCKYLDLNEDNVDVVYNGIHPEEFYPEQNEYCEIKSIKSYKIIVIGSLSDQKGHIYLLKALKKLQEKQLDFELLIVGDGPLKNKFIDFVSSNGLKEIVHFLGVRKDVANIMKSADLFVMPSVYEGFSIVLLEAMAAEIPIIATGVGGNAEAIINEESGLIINSENPDELVKSISRLINDKELSAKYASNARKRLTDNFTLTKMIQNLDQVYSKQLYVR
jgi:glycosyltransferase involved in cell wall biosynthesis